MAVPIGLGIPEPPFRPGQSPTDLMWKRIYERIQNLPKWRATFPATPLTLLGQPLRPQPPVFDSDPRPNQWYGPRVRPLPPHFPYVPHGLQRPGAYDDDLHRREPAEPMQSYPPQWAVARPPRRGRV